MAITLDRICIPIGLACDLDCKYCYRHQGKTSVPRLTDRMIQYLQSLDPKKTYCVIASGGEPLLYWKRVVELFSYVPKGIYKKVMSNGTHLTQEIVDYINENEVELHFSHDGPLTSWSRGVDVLEDPKILSLIKQVKNMRVHATIFAGNEDIIATRNYLQEKLGRTDFYFTAGTIFGHDPRNSTLLQGFDYDKYTKSWIQYRLERKDWTERYHRPRKGARSLGINILPDGTVVGLTSMKRYGMIDDDIETIKRRIAEVGDADICNNTECPLKQLQLCGNSSNAASAHTCKALIETTTAMQYLKHQKETEHNVTCF